MNNTRGRSPREGKQNESLLPRRRSPLVARSCSRVFQSLYRGRVIIFYGRFIEHECHGGVGLIVFEIGSIEVPASNPFHSNAGINVESAVMAVTIIPCSLPAPFRLMVYPPLIFVGDSVPAYLHDFPLRRNSLRS